MDPLGLVGWTHQQSTEKYAQIVHHETPILRGKKFRKNVSNKAPPSFLLEEFPEPQTADAEMGTH